MPPKPTMPPATPAISPVRFFRTDDELVAAGGAAPVVRTRVDDAAVGAEDDVVKEAEVRAGRIAEYKGLSVWFSEKIAAVKSFGGQPSRQGLDKQQPKNVGDVLAQDHQSPLVHAALVT